MERKDEDKVDANTLSFGKAHEDASWLWNHLVDKLMKKRIEMGKQLDDLQPTPMFDQVAQYLAQQPKFRTEKHAEEARELVEAFNNEYGAALMAGVEPAHSSVEPFEAAQIANLEISTFEEAVTLVPSLLQRFPDPKPLQDLLDRIQERRADPHALG